MELPCRVTWYVSGLGLNHDSAQRDGGGGALALLLARLGLHVAAVALGAAVLVVGTANRLEERRRRRRILSARHGVMQSIDGLKQTIQQFSDGV